MMCNGAQVRPPQSGRRRSSLGEETSLEVKKKKKPKEPFLQRIDCFQKIKPETRAKLVKLTTGMPFRAFFVACVLSNVITLSISNNDMTYTAAERSGHAPNEANIQFKAALENIEVVFAFFFFVEMMLKVRFRVRVRVRVLLDHHLHEP